MTRLRRLRDWPLRVQLAVLVTPILVAALGALTALDGITRDRIALMSMIAIVAIVVTFWFAGAIAAEQDRHKLELAETDRELAESEQKYRDLYESSPDMHLTTDLRSQKIVECNQTLCDRLGYTRSELLGQPF